MEEERSKKSSKKKNKKNKHREEEEEVQVEEHRKSPKKKKKNYGFDSIVKEEIKTEDENIEEDANEVEIKDISDGWPKENIKELIDRLKQQLPEKDSLRYASRVKRIDWDKVKFKDYSADDCLMKWTFINKKIRSYRLMSEILEDAKEWAEKPWSSFYGKKGKHPDQPNRPLSSYMLFYMKKKGKIARANPDLKMTEISKIIGEKYNALPKHKKDVYVNRAKEMQEEYKMALDKFYTNHPEVIPQNMNHKTPKAITESSSGIEKPLPPFKLFYNEKLKKHQNDESFDKNQFLDKCKEQWRNLSLKKKAIWIRWALDAECKYLEELSAYYSAREEPLPEHKSVLTKEEKAILEKMSGKPEKPPNSAYSLFSRVMLKSQDIKHLNEPPRNRMQEIARQWKLLPEEDKKKYAEQVQHMLESYKLEFANYLESLPEHKRAEELKKTLPKRKTPTSPAKKTKTEKISKMVEEEAVVSPELYEGEPEKPPGTVFELYVQHYQKRNPKLNPVKLASKAASQWKSLSGAEKEKYQKKLEQVKTKYLVEYEKFLKTLDEDSLKKYSKFKNEGNKDSSSDSEEDSSQDDEESSNETSSSEDSNEDSDT
uniref:HMG box domain-containing protein n=1 Tax=Clastoptera arizonana TaxID=38151 RepID=A0A1B6CTD5_9HEMI